MILRSKSRILLGKRINVVAKRYLKEGVLSVGGQEDISGRSEGELKSLDLGENLFLGKLMGNSDKLFDNIGIQEGFKGCLYLLRIGRSRVNLTFPGSTDIINAINLVNCQDLPCSNVTTCASL